MYISIYLLYLFDSFAAARIHVADVVDEKSVVVRVVMRICIALTSVPIRPLDEGRKCSIP
jgi:hypothetical protein